MRFYGNTFFRNFQERIRISEKAAKSLCRICAGFLRYGLPPDDAAELTEGGVAAGEAQLKLLHTHVGGQPFKAENGGTHRVRGGERCGVP